VIRDIGEGGASGVICLALRLRFVKGGVVVSKGKSWRLDVEFALAGVRATASYILKLPAVAELSIEELLAAARIDPAVLRGWPGCRGASN
jgi:hypothetical protein